MKSLCSSSGLNVQSTNSTMFLMRRVQKTMLDVEELLELEDNIRQELDDHLPGALSMLNRTGELEIFLKMLGMEHLLQKQSDIFH